MSSHYSVSELEARAASIIAEARSTKEPVFISQGGRASVLLIDAGTYLTKMQALGEFERIYRDESSIRPDRKPAEAAPAPQEEASPVPQYGWRCKVCGHIERVDELPDDFVCQLCGVGKEQFERIEL